ncbi:uncharacterized protein LOC128957262 [Oppia nitens]|uniref:uncharacterized protein LOC128957262 n=1 Tax=Oppia nitens TaxID=1686743 RepID=UPI0023DAA739|nr:uncharacterized protein LOC128957262 [Oppia nitens]
MISAGNKQKSSMMIVIIGGKQPSSSVLVVVSTVLLVLLCTSKVVDAAVDSTPLGVNCPAGDSDPVNIYNRVSTCSRSKWGGNDSGHRKCCQNVDMVEMRFQLTRKLCTITSETDLTASQEKSLANMKNDCPTDAKVTYDKAACDAEVVKLDGPDCVFINQTVGGGGGESTGVPPTGGGGNAATNADSTTAATSSAGQMVASIGRIVTVGIVIGGGQLLLLSLMMMMMVTTPIHEVSN